MLKWSKCSLVHKFWRRHSKRTDCYQFGMSKLLPPVICSLSVRAPNHFLSLGQGARRACIIQRLEMTRAEGRHLTLRDLRRYSRFGHESAHPFARANWPRVAPPINRPLCVHLSDWLRDAVRTDIDTFDSCQLRVLCNRCWDEMLMLGSLAIFFRRGEQSRSPHESRPLMTTEKKSGKLELGGAQDDYDPFKNRNLPHPTSWVKLLFFFLNISQI